MDYYKVLEAIEDVREALTLMETDDDYKRELIKRAVESLNNSHHWIQELWSAP